MMQSKPERGRGRGRDAEPDPWRPRIGLRVALQTSPVGVVDFPSLPAHRVTVHAGPPARTGCGVRRFRYRRGDIGIVPAGLSGSVFDDDAVTSLVVELPTSLVGIAAEEMGLDPDRAGLEMRHQLRDQQIVHIAWALEVESRAGNPNGLLYADSLGMALAVHLVGHYPAAAATRVRLSPRQLQLATDYIESHLDRNLSLVTVARAAEMGASHFKTLFRRTTGVPLHEYVMQRRVERAKRLLVEGEMAVAEVALEAGFAHQSHMARWMRRLLGVTPRAVARGARPLSPRARRR